MVRNSENVVCNEVGQIKLPNNLRGSQRKYHCKSRRVDYNKEKIISKLMDIEFTNLREAAALQ